MTTKATGDAGESLAAVYLASLGYHVLARQYRFERAEVDLVCLEPPATPDAGATLVFVEVKTRTGRGYGRPEEAVTAAKQRQLIKAAEAYIFEHRMHGTPSRFDVVSILIQQPSSPQVEHYKDAFWA